MKRWPMLAAFCLTSSLLPALPILDPAGDFLPGYAGPRNGDVDALSSNVTFTGTQLIFETTVNGPIGFTPGAVYVWGVNRGGATGDEAFPGTIDDVSFDSALAVQVGGFVIVGLLADNGPPVMTPLPLNLIEVSGNRLRVRVQSSRFPSTGFAPSEYTVSFWPRSGLTDLGNVEEISDFAPGRGMAQISTVPEPGTWALALAGCAAIGIRRQWLVRK